MADSMLKELRLDILKQEIELVQAKINHFDDLRHRTKQLALTLWAASVGLLATTDIDTFLLLAAFIPLPFWFMDSTYHRYQEGFTERLRGIRDFLRTGRFLVQREKEVSLVKSLESEDFDGFPIPDFYGNHTIEKDKHKKQTS